MHILMTGGAGIERQTGELLEFPAVPLFDAMTFAAVGFHMGTPQLELCGFVVETLCRLEFFHGMAIETVAFQRSLMGILMTGQTAGFKSEPGISTSCQRLVSDQTGLVACFAIQFPMSSFQSISRLFVLKIFLIEAHHLEIPSMMIAVTGYTCLLTDIRLCVQSSVAVPQRQDLFVAVQTFRICHPFTYSMTFGAIGESLIPRVVRMQVTRRNLTMGCIGKKCRQDRQQQDAYMLDLFQCFFMI